MADQIVPYHPSSFETFVRNMIRLPDNYGAFVVDRDGEVVGIAAVVMAPTYWNHSEPMAVEAFWFISKRHRGGKDSLLLMGALEEWAKDHGAVTMNMIALAVNPSVGKIYERLGYTLSELQYIRKL